MFKLLYRFVLFLTFSFSLTVFADYEVENEDEGVKTYLVIDPNFLDLRVAATENDSPYITDYDFLHQIRFIYFKEPEYDKPYCEVKDVVLTNTCHKKESLYGTAMVVTAPLYSVENGKSVECTKIPLVTENEQKFIIKFIYSKLEDKREYYFVVDQENNLLDFNAKLTVFGDPNGNNPVYYLNPIRNNDGQYSVVDTSCNKIRLYNELKSKN